MAIDQLARREDGKQHNNLVLLPSFSKAKAHQEKCRLYSHFEGSRIAYGVKTHFFLAGNGKNARLA